MDLTVIESVLEWVGSHPALGGLPVWLETLPADGSDAVMLQTLTGDPYIKRYKSGGYVASYPFAVYVRVNGGDTAARIDAMRALCDIGISIDDKAGWPTEPQGIDWMSLQLRTSPVRIAVQESGAEDYQATFSLTYRKRG